MKTRTRGLHLFALSVLFAAASQFFPAFCLKAFLYGPKADETLFSFRAPEGFTGESRGRPVSRGVSLDDEKRLVVDGGAGGVFGAEFPPPEGKETLLELSVYTQAPGQSQRITVVSGGKSAVLSRLSSVRDHKFRLTGLLAPDENFLLLVEPGGPGSKVFIEKIRLAQRPAAFLPWHAITLPVFLLFLCVFFSLVLKRYSDIRRAWSYSLGACALPLAGAALGLNALISPYYWLFMLTALAAFAQRAPRGPAVKDWLFPITALGAILRWNQYLAASAFPLAGDAGSYYQPALTLDLLHPFATGYREPFYIWLQKLWLLLPGPGEYQFRLLTVALSIGIIALTYLLFSELLKNKTAGLLAAFFVAVNNYAVFSSALGERTEAYTLLLLLFCYFVVRRKKAGWAGELPVILAGAALCLTWLIGGVGVFFIYLFRKFYRREPAKRLLLSAGLLLLLLVPHLHYERKVNGDIFYTLNKSVNYFRNSELHGEASNLGARTTWLDYLRERGGLTIIKRTAGGYASLFFNPAGSFNRIFMGFHYTQWYGWLIFPFYLAGLILALKRGQAWLFALLLAFTHAFPYNLYDIRDPRLLFFLAPLFAGFIALGFYQAGLLLARAVRARAPAGVT